MKQDRFLVGILTGIVVLIIAALSVFFLRQDKQTYAPEDAPEGVVHNYVLAVLNKDYLKAYNYLADLENKPSYDNFRRSFVTGSINPRNAGVKIGKADVTDEDATVEVSMMNTPSDPFASEYNNVGVAQLVKQNGAWKISSMPTYNMWDYSWYQPTPK
jgi:hypothetical protein